MYEREKMNELSEDILARYLNNECSEEDLNRISEWLGESDEHVQQLFKMEEVYHLGKSGYMLDESFIDRAERRLDKRLKEETERKQKIFRLRNVMKYAAVIAVLLMATSGLTYWVYQTASSNEMVRAVSSASGVRELLLPDGTKVWLNKASSLQYPRHFAENERGVYLEGEAYFEVTRNKQKPFIVRSEAMSVKVLGTSFNFKCSKDCRVAETTLISGEVEVRGNKEEGLIVLSPGQKAELNKTTRRLQVKQVDAEMDAVWHNDLIPFTQATVFDIAKVLERFYNVKIILSPEVSTSKTYSGVLKKKDKIESVLNSLKNTIPIRYKIVDDNIFISSDNN